MGIVESIKYWICNTFMLQLILFGLAVFGLFMSITKFRSGNVSDFGYSFGSIMVLLGFGSQIIALSTKQNPDTTLNISTLHSARILILGGIIIIFLAMLMDFGSSIALLNKF